MRIKAFRNGAIRFLQVGRVTLTLAIAKPRGAAPAPRKPRDAVARVRQTMRAEEARRAVESDRFAGACLAAVGLGFIGGAILSAIV
ncbi:hypothetical protein [Microcystis phage Mwe-JY26]